MYYGEVSTPESHPFYEYAQKNKELFDLITNNRELSSLIIALANQCVGKGYNKFGKPTIDNDGVLSFEIRWK